jgi:hypothetical protein
MYAATVARSRANLAPLFKTRWPHTTIRVTADGGKGAIKFDVPVGNTPASSALKIEHDNVSFLSLVCIEESADRLPLIVRHDQREICRSPASLRAVRPSKMVLGSHCAGASAVAVAIFWSEKFWGTKLDATPRIKIATPPIIEAAKFPRGRARSTSGFK